MASWSDYASLLITVSIFVVAAYGVLYVSQQWSAAMQSTKDNLKKRGVDVSGHGVSVKGKTKLADREEYCDATQRGFIKLLGSAHYGPANGSSPSASPKMAQPVLPHGSANHSRVDLPSHETSSHSPTPSYKSLNGGEEKRKWFSKK
ncbi:hypothetical protein EIP91_000152 [Steccherinum ochraceum]|uniref:Uncharacterized protein n=1 Tax=Steccherinum ochraceum TaxID=92696 RepID=A0A4R0RQ95_9APHY|nr:hypothetical protein EIP91_000152 [Steccherinum ochraceum]